jgi:hydroxymethylglutaryl-CoA lyase
MRAMIRRARAEGIEVRAGLQCVWSCGTDGPTPEDHAVAMAREVLDEGVDLLSLADSTGEADPVRVARLLDRVLPLAGPVPLVLHLHDTRGMALPNIVAALQLGVTRFDTALGGMGGCPFIPGATGNVATEDTAHLLARMGVETGIDVAAVAALTRRLEAFLGRSFSGRVYPLLAPPAA